MEPDFEPAHPAPRRRGLIAGSLLLLGLPLAGWSAHAWVNRDRGPASRSTQAGQGSAETLAPGLLHVQLKGEGYALGHMHGTLLRSEVRFIVRYLDEQLLGGGLTGGAKRDLLLRKAWQLDAFIPARYRDEMQGIADGAGVRYADILLINCFDDLQYLAGCSSAVALPHSGPVIHARNLDYGIPELARHKVVFDLDVRGVKLRTVGFPGYAGVLTGMSSRGLGLSSHTSSAFHEAVGIPTGILYRQMLEEGTDLASMKGLLEKGPRTIGNNLALSDAHRREALALEFDAQHLVQREPSGGRLFVTNHFQVPGMRACQDQGWWVPTSGSSARVACLAAALPADGPMDQASVLKAMSEYGNTPAWRTPANRGTVQSVLMEPADGRLWIAKGQRPPVSAGGYLELPPAW
jgi:hypothetical protein